MGAQFRQPPVVPLRHNDGPPFGLIALRCENFLTRHLAVQNVILHLYATASDSATAITDSTTGTAFAGDVNASSNALGAYAQVLNTGYRYVKVLAMNSGYGIKQLPPLYMGQLQVLRVPMVVLQPLVLHQIQRVDRSSLDGINNRQQPQ